MWNMFQILFSGVPILYELNEARRHYVSLSSLCGWKKSRVKTTQKSGSFALFAFVFCCCLSFTFFAKRIETWRETTAKSPSIPFQFLQFSILEHRNSELRTRPTLRIVNEMRSCIFAKKREKSSQKYSPRDFLRLEQFPSCQIGHFKSEKIVVDFWCNSSKFLGISCH